MYQVTDLFREKIKDLDRIFRIDIQIQHSTGVLELTDVDIVGGSVSYTESSQSGEEFTVGGVVASNFTVELMQKQEYANIEFAGATIIPQIALLLREKQDTDSYFLHAPQPSRMFEDDVEELWEYVPLGRFHIDDVNRQRNTIKLKAIDNMINLEKPYTLSKTFYPATLYQVYLDICNTCDIQIGTLDFPNKLYWVNERPEGEFTFRDILSYVCELSGTFARINRYGALELKWYEESNITIAPDNRFNFIPRDDEIKITGVMANIEDKTYLTGTDEYVIDLSENPLLQGDYETVLPNIFNNVKLTSFYPYESNWQGNPSLQAGDIVTHIDIDGKVIRTLVTTSTYKYRGSSILSAKGTPIIKKGFKGSTNKKIANIVRKVEDIIADKLTSVEQAQVNATEMIANMLGGYLITGEDAIYIADNPDLKIAKKVWKWGLGGFGYSSNGVQGPYNTGITADGSIVTMLIAANIITADMIRAGILQSEDGSTWINLNDGSFSFKNVLKYANDELIISSPDMDNIKTSIEQLETNVSNVDNKVEINNESINSSIESLGTAISDSFSNSSLTLIEANSLRLSLLNVISESTQFTTICDQLGIIAEKEYYLNAITALETKLNGWINKQSADYPLFLFSFHREEIFRLFAEVESFKTMLIDKISQKREESAKKYTDDNALRQGVQYNKVSITPNRGIVATHGDGTETILDGDGFKRRVISSGKAYDYISLDASGSFTTAGSYAQNGNERNPITPATVSYLDAQGVGVSWITLPNLDFRGRRFVVIPSLMSIGEFYTGSSGGSYDTVWGHYLDTDVQLLEYDYINARFKIRARKREHAMYRGDYMNEKYSGLKMSYYAYALS